MTGPRATDPRARRRPVRLTDAEDLAWSENVAYRKMASFSDYVRWLLDQDAKEIDRERAILRKVVGASLGREPSAAPRCQSVTDAGVGGVRCDRADGHAGAHLASRSDGVSVAWGRSP